MRKTIYQFDAMLNAWGITPIKRTLLWIEYRISQSVVERVASLADAMSITYDRVGETFVTYSKAGERK